MKLTLDLDLSDIGYADKEEFQEAFRDHLTLSIFEKLQQETKMRTQDVIEKLIEKYFEPELPTIHSCVLAVLEGKLDNLVLNHHFRVPGSGDKFTLEQYIEKMCREYILPTGRQMTSIIDEVIVAKVAQNKYLRRNDHDE